MSLIIGILRQLALDGVIAGHRRNGGKTIYLRIMPNHARMRKAPARTACSHLRVYALNLAGGTLLCLRIEPLRGLA
jgi:hypothetical protein